MPWRGPEEPGEFPTLGHQVAAWIEASCAIPDGDYAGAAYVLTDEMYRFLLWYYRLDPDTGLFVLTAGFLARSGTCCDRGCRHCPYVGGA